MFNESSPGIPIVLIMDRFIWMPEAWEYLISYWIMDNYTRVIWIYDGELSMRQFFGPDMRSCHSLQYLFIVLQSTIVAAPHLQLAAVMVDVIWAAHIAILLDIWDWSHPQNIHINCMAQIRNLSFQPGVDTGCGRLLSSQQTDSAHFRSQKCREQDLKQMLSKVGVPSDPSVWVFSFRLEAESCEFRWLSWISQEPVYWSAWRSCSYALQASLKLSWK